MGQVVDQRQVVLQSVNVAVETFNKLLANCNGGEILLLVVALTGMTEGVKFYTDVMKDYLNPLSQTVTDFVMARNTEQQVQGIRYQPSLR